MATFQEEVKEESLKLLGGCRQLLAQVRTASIAVGLECTLADNLEAIAEVVATEAATRRLSAGYSGSHDDGGASRQMDKLKGYLDGVVTGLSGVVSANSPYNYLLEQIRREQDPEYQKYLELKAKFGDK